MSKQINVGKGSKEAIVKLPAGVKVRSFRSDVSQTSRLQTLIQEYLLFNEVTPEDYKIIADTVKAGKGRGSLNSKKFFNNTADKNTRLAAAQVIYSQLDDASRAQFIKDHSEKLGGFIPIENLKVEYADFPTMVRSYLNKSPRENRFEVTEGIDNVINDANVDIFTDNREYNARMRTEQNTREEDQPGTVGDTEPAEDQPKTVTGAAQLVDARADAAQAFRTGEEGDIEGVTGGTAPNREVVEQAIEEAGTGEGYAIRMRQPIDYEEANRKVMLASNLEGNDRDPDVSVESTSELDPDVLLSGASSDVSQRKTAVWDLEEEKSNAFDDSYTNFPQAMVDTGVDTDVGDGQVEEGDNVIQMDEPVIQSNTKDYVTETNPRLFSVKYHKVPFYVFFGSIENPNIDVELDRSIDAIVNLKEFDSSYYCELIVDAAENKILVEDVVDGSVQEFRELIQLYFLLIRQLQKPVKGGYGRVPLSELAALAQTVSSSGGSGGPAPGPSLSERMAKLSTSASLDDKSIAERNPYREDNAGIPRPHNKFFDIVPQKPVSELTLYEPVARSTTFALPTFNSGASDF